MTDCTGERGWEDAWGEGSQTEHVLRKLEVDSVDILGIEDQGRETSGGGEVVCTNAGEKERRMGECAVKAGPNEQRGARKILGIEAAGAGENGGKSQGRK